MADRQRENRKVTPKERLNVAGFIIKENLFTTDQIKLIKSMPSGDSTLVIFFEMMALACRSKAGGFLIMHRNVPFDEQTLAALFDRNLQEVQYALTMLKKFGMIDDTPEGFCMADFIDWMPQEDKSREKTRQRVAKYREQKQLPAPTEGKEKRVYTDDCIEMTLSKYLFSKMRANNPEAKEPNFQSWCNHIRFMIERDSRKPDQIKNMIDWCQADSFWKTNILSTKKLREKYDQLKVRALEDYNRQKALGGTGTRRQQEVDDMFNRLLTEGENGQ